MTSRQSVPSPCSDLSTNQSLSLTIGYIGEVCQNSILIFGLSAILAVFPVIRVFSVNLQAPV